MRTGEVVRCKEEGSAVWPVVTIRARDQKEVDCLLYTFAQAGIACLQVGGFRVEVGGGTTAQILKAVQACLTRDEIESVGVVLRSGREHVMLRERSAG
jgi:hypothetical protein